MKDSSDRMESDFVLARPRYEQFTDDLRALLERLLRDVDLEYFQIETRTKDVDSFRKKIQRPDKAGKYLTISDITDLSGVRIILLYQKDVDKIRGLIESNFDIDWKNSTNKTETIEPDRFGYLSVHYIVGHSASRARLPEHHAFADLKAEIQVRTVLQHAWAAVDRALRYENEDDLPRSVKRRFYRVSALLELGDDELTQIDREIASLRANYEKKIARGEFDQAIDRESLDVFFQQTAFLRDVERIGRALGFSEPPDPSVSRKSIASLAKALNGSGIRTLSEFQDILKGLVVTAEDDLSSFAKAMNESNAKINFSAVGMIRVLLMMSDQYGQAVIDSTDPSHRLRRWIAEAVRLRKSRDRSPSPKKRK